MNGHGEARAAVAEADLDVVFGLALTIEEYLELTDCQCEARCTCED